MNVYKVLNKQEFRQGSFKIVPIRSDDRYKIMKWRNQQIYHLRQQELLTEEDQDQYFNTIINNQFQEEKPNQILFSFLDNDICVGYGGLVHINWLDKNSEISFLINTELEQEKFGIYWANFLVLIEAVAFQEIGIHKIFTYAFDVRPKLYDVLLNSGFEEDSRLKEHVYFEDKFLDVLIHMKIKNRPALRKALPGDVDRTFRWANDPRIRKYSFNKNPINYEDHKNWFLDKLNSSTCAYFILQVGAAPVGSIRFDMESDSTIARISYLVDSEWSGKGLGTIILKAGMSSLCRSCPRVQLVQGEVIKCNIGSIRIFEKLNFSMREIGGNIVIFEKKILCK